jgi:hypothetical protein
LRISGHHGVWLAGWFLVQMPWPLWELHVEIFVAPGWKLLIAWPRCSAPAPTHLGLAEHGRRARMRAAASSGGGHAFVTMSQRRAEGRFLPIGNPLPKRPRRGGIRMRCACFATSSPSRCGWKVLCADRFGQVPAQILHEWNVVGHVNDFHPPSSSGRREKSRLNAFNVPHHTVRCRSGHAHHGYRNNGCRPNR